MYQFHSSVLDPLKVFYTSENVNRRMHLHHCHLYADKKQNFVFGEAVPDKGVGVFSFDRFTTAFTDAWNKAFSDAENKKGYNPSNAWPCHPTMAESVQTSDNSECVQDSGIDFLLRAMKTLAHEILHLFGLEHCPFYQCVINGSDHMGEMDESPLHLCPICLRKLYSSLPKSLVSKTNVLERFQHLSEFLQKIGQEESASWYRAAAKRCR